MQIKDSIEFQFSLYNMTNVYIVAGIGIVFLIVVVFLIKNAVGGRKQSSGSSNYSNRNYLDSSVPTNTETTFVGGMDHSSNLVVLMFLHPIKQILIS